MKLLHLFPFFCATLVLQGCPAPEVPVVPKGDTFSVLVLSDPQVKWYTRVAYNNQGRHLLPPDEVCKVQHIAPPPGVCSKLPSESEEECVNRCSSAAYDDEISSLRNVKTVVWPTRGGITVNGGQQIADVNSVVINGDLTAFWHPTERDAYINKFDSEDDGIPGAGATFYGLGNHDIYNNLCKCKGWLPWDLNSCVRNAAITTKDTYKGFNGQGISGISYDYNSNAYSYTIGDYHFVQLHLNPSYSVDARWHFGQGEEKCLETSNVFGDHSSLCDKELGVFCDSFDWLKADLDKADTDGKLTIVNFHVTGWFADTPPLGEVYGTYWGKDDTQRLANLVKFRDILSTHAVAAVFGGHIHGSYGHLGDYMLPDSAGAIQTVTNNSGRTIPWFRSGASEYYTYLIAEFGKDATGHYMNVGTIDFAGAGTAFRNTTWDGRAIAPQTFRLD